MLKQKEDDVWVKQVILRDGVGLRKSTLREASCAPLNFEVLSFGCWYLLLKLLGLS
jgi:hypothetical protein